MSTTSDAPRVVFMGTPAFAVPILAALVERYPVVGVVTQPDRPAGRSGCVTTPTTGYRSTKAARMGTAKAGVPMKTTRGASDVVLMGLHPAGDDLPATGRGAGGPRPPLLPGESPGPLR